LRISDDQRKIVARNVRQAASLSDIFQEMAQMKTDFCEYCNAPLTGEEKLVTVYRHYQSQHFIFERAPARVCPRCGERYFSARVVREMDYQMRQPQSLADAVAVPVIQLKLAS
jgi:YgiT-type zinc finger domain-containing protein